MRNAAFRAWAKSRGYSVKAQPEALQGDGDVWGVRLGSGRGWLWDAGASIGIDYRSTRRRVAAMARNLAKMPGFRLQTEAADAVLGWVSPADWGAGFEALLRPRRSPRRVPRGPQEMAPATR